MMSTSNTEHIDDDKERLRNELRALRRVKASPSFDAELQQRLKRRASWSISYGKPIPSYALSAIAVVVLSVVGYYVLLRPASTIDVQSIEGQGQPGEFEVSTPASQPTPELPSITPQQGSQNISPGEPARKGPASVGSEATTEAKVENRQTGTTSGATSQTQIEFRYSPDISSQSQK